MKLLALQGVARLTALLSYNLKGLAVNNGKGHFHAT